MNRRVLVLAALLGVSISLACDTILDIQPVPAATDEGGTDDGATDSAAPKCDPAAPFGTPTAVPGLSSDGVAAIGLSPDERVAFICRTSPVTNAPAELFVATRSSPSGTFGSEGSVPTDERACIVTATNDFLSLVWSEFDPPDGQSETPSHLYMTTRPSLNADFNLVDGGRQISTPAGASATGPFLSPDGTELYYTVVTGLVPRSYQASADSGYGLGAPVPGLPSEAYAMVVSPNGLIAYFVSQGGLHVATRDSRSSPFGGVTSVSVVDAGKTVQIVPVLVSDDACKFYYDTFDESFNLADGASWLVTRLYVVTKTPN